uniref:Signal transducing adaptor family member 2 n=1 Tax=Suricata suricatta TaxID=37032 RepID=A0A673UFJ1_SURSU
SAHSISPRKNPDFPSHLLFLFGPQDYKKFWAGLQGCTLYFYNSNRASQHVEKLDLAAFVKLKDETPWGSSRDPGTHFSLVLRNQEIKFKVGPCLLLRVPSNLTLLPGHLYMMAEVLAKEEARRALEVPSCFLKVSRLEAQLLLERYPECGNLLLRPSGDGTGGVSVTTRQSLNGTWVVRHYKVKHEGPKYVIDVEEPFSCASLHAVVNYFVSHTKKALVPFLPEEDYEKVLGYVEADKENGESVWVSRDCCFSPGPTPPSGGPKQLPPVPVTPASSQDKLTPLPDQDENYVIPIADSPVATYVNGDGRCGGRDERWGQGRRLKGRCDVPHLCPHSHGLGIPRAAEASPAPRPRPPPGLADLTAELEEKLQRRRALEHSAGHAGDQ